MSTATRPSLVLSRAIVRDMVPQDEAASMIGWVTMGMAVVPMLAPALAGALLAPETGAWPLIWLMLLTSVASVACILYVIRRAREVGSGV